MSSPIYVALDTPDLERGERDEEGRRGHAEGHPEAPVDELPEQTDEGDDDEGGHGSLLRTEADEGTRPGMTGDSADRVTGSEPSRSA